MGKADLERHAPGLFTQLTNNDQKVAIMSIMKGTVNHYRKTIIQLFYFQEERGKASCT